METLLQDLRYAVRALLRSPGFTAVAVLTLALGIGANTAIFSVVNALLMRPIPGVDRPDDLVAVYTSDFSSGLYGTSSYPDYIDYRDQATGFSGLASFSFASDATLSAGGDPERVSTVLVTGNYFETLGVDATAGRLLLPADAAPGAQPLAVISSALWQQRFGSAPGVVGSTVNLNGQPFTVIGVAPRDFQGTTLSAAPEVWVPMAMAETLAGRGRLLEERGARWLGMVGRLAPGVTIDEAGTQIRTIAARLGEAYPETNLGTLQAPDQPRPMTLVPASEAMVGPSQRETTVRIAWLLMTTVGLVLLIACANLANLLLARATSRAREIAVRLSLGAARRRIVRQLLTESVLLAGIGGAAGLLLAQWVGDSILASLATGFAAPEALPEATIDAGVLAFTFAISLAAGVIFGLAPALRASRPNLTAALKEGGPGTSGIGRRFGLRDALVIGQVALALLLLIGTGLFVESLRRTLAIDVGYTLEQALLASIDLGSAEYTPSQGLAFYEELERRVESLPGVQAVSYAAVVPVSPFGSRTSITVDGYEPRPGEDMEINFNVVGQDFFRTMDVSLLAGRGFRESDREGAAPVVVVNETFARRYWGGEDAAGKQIRFGGPDDEPVEVVGVVRDGKYRNLREDPLPYIYRPLPQTYEPRLSIVVSTVGDPMNLAPSVRAELARLDPELPLFDVRTLREHLGTLVAPERAVTALVTGFGLLALLLAALGIYGLMSFLVTQRTREIGVRMALGARAADTLTLVMRNGLALTAAGLLFGAVAALLLGRLVSGFLFGVSAADPAVYALTALVLAAAATLATYLPARRAARVDPMVALRAE